MLNVKDLSSIFDYGLVFYYSRTMFDSHTPQEKSDVKRRANELIDDALPIPVGCLKEDAEIVWSGEFGSWFSTVGENGKRFYSYLGFIGNLCHSNTAYRRGNKWAEMPRGSGRVGWELLRTLRRKVAPA